MRKIITVILLLTLSMSFAQEISFSELVSLKTKPISLTEQLLKTKKYSYYNTQNKGIQWKANDGSGIIGFNGKGVVLFMSYNNNLYKKIVNQMKALSYKHDAILNKDKAKGDAYIKGKNTVYLNTVSNPDNGKPIYSITII